MQRRATNIGENAGFLRGALAGLLWLALLAAPLRARADTVASLLGNFTINQFCALQLTDESVKVHYAVVFGQLPALSELHRADSNGDGVTSQAERDAYVQRLAPEFARQLQLVVDGAAVPLYLTHWTSSLPTEQGGFSLRLDADFTGALSPDVARGEHALRFSNHNYDGRFGWHEITVQASHSIQVSNTNGFDTSLTAGLTQALQALPMAGPLDERALELSFTHDALPTGAVPLGPRPGAAPALVQRTGTLGNSESNWLQARTQALIKLISAPRVELHITLLALLTAFVLGALHAFSPGHGKTIVGAYLIGSRGTAKHAAFLGMTVTITHTLGVFILGCAMLFASQFIVPERLFPVLSLLSGLIVLGMGMILLAQRWRAASRTLFRRPTRVRGPARPSALGLAMAAPLVNAEQLTHPAGAHYHERSGHSHDHEHRHDHGRGHFHSAHDHIHEHEHARGASHGHSHSGALMHSHGGSVHSHLPPDTEVRWRNLLALGISGGLLPCPSAMVLLLAAVALNKTAYGMLLVLAFSVGLAVTLTGVGFAFLYARSRLPSAKLGARWPLLLPVMSAAAIMVIGIVLCFGALQSARL
jgi:nickel/cobalt transporter (NicO) family protein